MEIEFLGGAGEVGRSAILVNDALLLDYGMLAGNPPQYPVGSVEPEAVVVSHGHLDHVGAIPSLLAGNARPPIHWTPPTYELTMLLARDTLKLHGTSPLCPFTGEERKRVTEVSVTHGYGEPFEAAGHEVTLYDAGHIPGSAHVLVDDGDTRLLYTADFHTDDQQLVAGTTARPGGRRHLREHLRGRRTRRPGRRRAPVRREPADDGLGGRDRRRAGVRHRADPGDAAGL